MQIGDTVVFTGTVKDMVRSKDGSTTSVLTGATDLTANPVTVGKEYWFDETHLKGVAPPTELEAQATAAGFKLEKIPPATAPGTPQHSAPAHSSTAKHG